MESLCPKGKGKKEYCQNKGSIKREEFLLSAQNIPATPKPAIGAYKKTPTWHLLLFNLREVSW